MSIAAMFALAVIAIGTSGGTDADSTGGSGKLPRPASTAVYPVKFPGWENPSPRPTPTVSYPIPWDRSQ